MNKSELIDHIAQQADISKAAASRALEAAIDAITDTLKNGDSVSLVGFGTFVATEREARTGRNIANPIGQIWCGAMMLEFLGHKEAHDAVLAAIEKVLSPGSGAPRTPDLGGTAGTVDVGKAIAAALS